jgi:hypothetical protein
MSKETWRVKREIYILKLLEPTFKLAEITGSFAVFAIFVAVTAGEVVLAMDR